MESLSAVFLKTEQPRRHPSPTVKATDLAYLVFERPDLEVTEHFLRDFGLTLAHRTADTLYFRGTGSSPWFYKVVKANTAAFKGVSSQLMNPVEARRLSCEIPQVLSLRLCGIAKPFPPSRNAIHCQSITTTSLHA
jgi:hypothetical protein